MHHSDVFKKWYSPHYRVMSNTYIPFLPLFAELDKRLVKGAIVGSIIAGEAGAVVGATIAKNKLDNSK